MTPEDSPKQDSPAVPFTAWHVFLVEVLMLFTDANRVEVRDFVKLGSLPTTAGVCAGPIGRA